MKRILFLAPYSIPVNNPEAICNAKILKVLSEAGYRIDVISKNNFSAYAPDAEEEIFTSHLASVKIFTLSNRIGWQSILDHFRVWFKTGYVYKGAHWAIYAIEHAEMLLRKNKYDWIMSRSPSSELAALYLSRKYHIKWIANWNDPYPEKRMPNPYGGGVKAPLSFLEKRLVRQVALQADWHSFPSDRLRDYMLEYMKEVKKEKTIIIPHVCLENLFVPRAREKSSKLILVHSGNVSYPRDPNPFLQGVSLFLTQERKAELEIYFIGKQSKHFNELIHETGLEDTVTVVPPRGYVDNLAFIEQADVAVLIEAPSRNSVFLPTKVGDYMQCGKDIFAVSPKEGILHDLYKESAVEYFADCTDPQAIALELGKIYSRKDTYKKPGKSKQIYRKYAADAIRSIYSQLLG